MVIIEHPWWLGGTHIGHIRLVIVCLVTGYPSPCSEAAVLEIASHCEGPTTREAKLPGVLNFLRVARVFSYHFFEQKMLGFTMIPSGNVKIKIGGFYDHW